MWNIFKCAFVCVVFGTSSTLAQAQVFLGSLLGDNNNSNNNNIPLIGALGLGSNNNQQNRFNDNFNQFANDKNQYPNNNNNQYNNNNANRGLLSGLSALGVNANGNRPTNNLNNFNRYPNTGQNNPTKNENDLNSQMKEAEKVLERLKELNRLKEQQKLQQEKENNQGQAGTGNNDPQIDKSDNNNINMKDDRVKTNVLKSLTKERFYFMVKPVVPENEAGKYEQTVYYVD